MTKWDYKIIFRLSENTLVSIDDKHTTYTEKDMLKELGEQGWELVSVSGNRLGTKFYFRRPKQALSPDPTPVEGYFGGKIG